MTTHNQQAIDELAKQAELILNEGSIQADALFVKTASIRSELNKLKIELTEDLATRGSKLSREPK